MSLAWRSWPNIECLLDSFVIFQGFQASIAKQHYICMIFQGALDPLSTPLDPRMTMFMNLRVGARAVAATLRQFRH